MAPRVDSDGPAGESLPGGGALAGRATTDPEKSVGLDQEYRHPEQDPRFRGPAGELRGHVEVSGDGPFPTEWTLVLRPSNTLFGRELAEERTVEFDDGRQDFEVQGLPLAGYDVVATAEGMNGIALPVLIDKHNHTPFVNLRMSPAGFLEGVVRTAQGPPADGFPVTLMDPTERSSVETLTDELGRYRFESVLDGPYQLILGRPSSPIVGGQKPLRFQAPSMILPDIELPPLGELTVKLVDENRRLLPDAIVKGSGNQGGVFEGSTDAYGLFTTRYLPAGRYRVRMELEGFLSKRITLELAEGEAQELTLQMLRDS